MTHATRADAITAYARSVAERLAHKSGGLVSWEWCYHGKGRRSLGVAGYGDRTRRTVCISEFAISHESDDFYRLSVEHKHKHAHANYYRTYRKYEAYVCQQSGGWIVLDKRSKKVRDWEAAVKVFRVLSR